MLAIVKTGNETPISADGTTPYKLSTTGAKANAKITDTLSDLETLVLQTVGLTITIPAKKTKGIDESTLNSQYCL